MNHRTFLVVILPSALLAAQAAAQTPRLSLERVEEALCEKADADGDSFRPKLCDPRCDCLTASILSAVNACTETSPGIFVAEEAIPAHDAWCSGACRYINLDPPFDVFFGDECYASNDCPSVSGLAGGCLLYDPANPPILGGYCRDPSASCTSNTQCAGGYSCDFGFCQKQSTNCFTANGLVLGSTPIVGEPLAARAVALKTLFGVGPAESSAVVDCGGQKINSNDALECIAQVETAIGQPCTPFSP